MDSHWAQTGRADYLGEVSRGTFNFRTLETLLVEDEDADSEADSEEEQ